MVNSAGVQSVLVFGLHKIRRVTLYQQFLPPNGRFYSDLQNGVGRQRDKTETPENITLQQTTYAGSKNKYAFQ